MWGGGPEEIFTVKPTLVTMTCGYEAISEKPFHKISERIVGEESNIVY